MTLLKDRMKGRNERKELSEGLEKRRVPLIFVLINRKQGYEVFRALIRFIYFFVCSSFPDGPRDAGRFCLCFRFHFKEIKF